jgi:2-oxoglutarate dehydrogenase E2 component (dihydrolipoamide succinyltransferase)
MTSRVEIPALGESVTEAIVSQWLKGEGDRVRLDEPICELESDKATVDLPAPASGVLHQRKHAGETARVGEIIAEIEEGSSTPPARPERPKAERPAMPEPAEPKPPVEKPADENKAHEANVEKKPEEKKTKEAAPPKPAKAWQVATPTAKAARSDIKAAPGDGKAPPPAVPATRPAEEGTRRVPMSKIRRSIAERLVRAQHTAAMLTTFNEIDMTAIQELRARHGEQFAQAHGVKLGLVSFFARACVIGLKHFPDLNAMLDVDDIVYHDHVHLGVAVSTDRGLVVPVLQNVETMSFARIEGEIKRAAAAAKGGKLSIQDLSGGTFTITNGGVFGSLLSTPILNPPQTGILGMHTIQERPVAVKRQVEIRPMMYVALTYDHRLVDGQTAVSFLVRLKHLLEDPLQMILEM